MARYQLALVYDGTGFFGSQRQASTRLSPDAKKRTVQGELENALCDLGWKGRSIILAGRTDAGVHATGQVAAVDLDWTHADDELVRALNALLPSDMAVRKAEVVHEKFHPRFDATSRRYQYRLFCQPIREPMRERHAWRVWPPIKGDELKRTANLFLGTHDFSSYGSPTTPKGTTVRTVIKAAWTHADRDEWMFDVQADAFLYRMVRRLVFVQVAVAQGRLPAESIARSLADQPSAGPESSRKAGSRSGLPSGIAPAHGLTLVEVTYNESIRQKE